MAKKKPEPPKVQAVEPAEPVIRHARIELPDPIYQRLTRMADRFQLSIAGYIRMAVVKSLESDEQSSGRKP